MNCIWITIDSLRQDHVHCYCPEGASDPSGEGIRVETPNIDRLASEGVLFERMQSESLPTICARPGAYLRAIAFFPGLMSPLTKAFTSATRDGGHCRRRT